MEKQKIQKILKQIEPKSMQNFLDIVWKKAKDEFVWDMNNKKYIDFSSTIFVMNAGHSNRRVIKYLKKQLNSGLLHTYTFAHSIRAKFIEKLIQIAPSFCQKVFLLSSGTEATEAAVKLMRSYTKRNIIVSFKGSMHGRTMAAELMRGSGIYHHPDFVHLDFPNDSSNFLKDINKLKIDTHQIAGFMIETYQGWSAKFMPKEYIKSLVSFAHKNKSLVCFDEVQSGFGRTGKLFGYEHYEVEPDIICIGKAIGGGLPLSGVLGRSEILNVPNVGDMSSTHSANPLCCAAGLAVLEEFESNDKVIGTCLKESCLWARLMEMDDKYENIIKEINCKGMLAGIIFKNKKIADDVCRKCLEEGLILVHTGRESIKIGPPLVISMKNLWKGLDILEGVLHGYGN